VSKGAVMIYGSGVAAGWVTAPPTITWAANLLTRSPQSPNSFLELNLTYNFPSLTP
jgi:hypothetical protein